MAQGKDFGCAMYVLAGFADEIGCLRHANHIFGIGLIDLSSHCPGLQIDIAQRGNASEDPAPKDQWVGPVVVARNHMDHIPARKSMLPQQHCKSKEK